MGASGDDAFDDDPTAEVPAVDGDDVNEMSVEAEVTDEAIASLIDSETAAAGSPEVDGAEPGTPADISEEAVVRLIAERDGYLEQLQRAKAEFQNARKRSDERLAAQQSQAAAGLVEKLLPVLDSCDAALGQGIDEVRPISDALFEILGNQGLQRVDTPGEAFDPEVHEAVMYEEGEGLQIVSEVLRAGYRWNDRVLRAAMVKVQG